MESMVTMVVTQIYSWIKDLTELDTRTYKQAHVKLMETEQSW